MLKCVIIDDERSAIGVLEDYIAQMPNLELVMTFTDPVLALNEITGSENKFDIVFMDINMPHLDGLALSKTIKTQVKWLVLATAYNEFASEAFEVGASAYLLKPFSFPKFAAAITKLIEKENNSPIINKQDNFFFVKVSEKENKQNVVKVHYDDIIAVESLKNYINIHTLKGSLVVYLTLSEIKKTLLLNEKFIQVHRSFIISKQHIEEVENYRIKMTHKLLIPIGISYRDEFNEYINSRTAKTGRF
ncbi:LytR/AlgR family response regulator transcription factor [Olivibacter domesticus]|uniref:Two component transcriptional regulator, LytTR family n=1 Tax=Olivibacter domesticus TaxID=407022 RepID=A0A1H7Y4R4_OLID1|nr:LytTR family DNA-binding domain-containing protein [Olivibacter domesticus]SEM41120.1 two component transcriptional regulator, LytTR family [Olivibacter domesticus]